MDFSCPQCGQELELSESKRGARVRCPICRNEFQANDRLERRSREAARAAVQISEADRAATIRSQSSPAPVIPPTPARPSLDPAKPKSGAGIFRIIKIVAVIAFFFFVKGGHRLFAIRRITHHPCSCRLSLFRVRFPSRFRPAGRCRNFLKYRIRGFQILRCPGRRSTSKRRFLCHHRPSNRRAGSFELSAPSLLYFTGGRRSIFATESPVRRVVNCLRAAT